MANSNVPRIFANLRREAAGRRALLLQRGDDAARWLIEDLVQDVLERLAFMQFPPGRALVTGLGSAEMASKLRGNGYEVTASPSIDEEQPITGGPFNLIISLNRLGTVNDLPGALIHMRKALAPAGIVIASAVGAGSLTALRQIMLAADGDRPAARIHPLIDNRAASSLLARAGFARHVVDSVQLKVSYASLERLIADLREQALTNVLTNPPPPLTRTAIARARAEFERLSDKDGRLAESFEILTLTGWI